MSRALVRYTCPDIDKVITSIKEAMSMAEYINKICDNIEDAEQEANNIIDQLWWIGDTLEEGYTVLSGGGGVDADDIWFDEDTLFDEEVKEYFNYNIIKKEYNERQY